MQIVQSHRLSVAIRDEEAPKLKEVTQEASLKPLKKQAKETEMSLRFELVFWI